MEDQDRLSIDGLPLYSVEDKTLQCCPDEILRDAELIHSVLLASTKETKV